MTPDITKAQEARIAKILDTKFRYRGEVHTWRTFAETGAVVAKRIRTEEYARRKTHLEYKKLKAPKDYYCLEFADNTYIETSRTVYDWFPAPELVN